MDKTQLFNKVAAMLSTKEEANGKVAKAGTGKIPDGKKANSKDGMSNNNVKTTNKQNPNRTYPASIVAKATERIGGR